MPAMQLHMALQKELNIEIEIRNTISLSTYRISLAEFQII
ncbi:hypothetical protein P305_11185 [Xylella fastidiosa subsp. fastidiosa Mus-1]|nr:hypothetical protein P305_11185 [Xylella fastidiosa subsp. fastidiosa Mus-1]